MQHTLTGHFPLALRRGSSPWQRDLDRFIEFAKELEIGGVDVEALPISDLQRILDAGLRIGCVDLINDPQRVQWTDLASPDHERRKRGALAQAEYVKSAADLGVANFFAIAIPEDPARARKENFEFAIDGFGQLARHIASTGAKIVLEGWPGRWPYFSSLV